MIFAVVAFVGGAALLHRTPRDTSYKLDVPGTLLASTGLFGLVYGFSNAETHGWGWPATWGMPAAGAVLVAVFVWWRNRAAYPLLPLRVLLDRNRGASFAALFVTGAGMFGVFLFLTYYLQQSRPGQQRPGGAYRTEAGGPPGHGHRGGLDICTTSFGRRDMAAMTRHNGSRHGRAGQAIGACPRLRRTWSDRCPRSDSGRSHGPSRARPVRTQGSANRFRAPRPTTPQPPRRRHVPARPRCS
ncbi:hypothetical protein JK359_18660 [Streptomyces actinomycinicus]|uniref:MFS transporter n=1 Tax=Streptomyces actinomycinicus TaxID=1695166 RepID=A0A937JP27_9ACTN|nr:hypothetical protein [Streptomyces actinomycinicus]